MLNTKIIGERIKELRRQHGLTQNAFADALHVSFQAVSNWERGVAPPDLENLVQIAAYFHVLVDDLLHPTVTRLLLGVDGGGTKTEFVVTTLDGTVLKRFVRGGSNPNALGFNRASAVIHEGIREALLEYPSIASVFCGISGLSVGDNRRQMLLYLQERYPRLTLDAQTDSASLFAMDETAEMAVISGTGSAVFVHYERDYVRLGGWGYLLDTGGSAFDIGRDALRVALAEEEALRVPCLMSRMLKDRLQISGMWDAVSQIYQQGTNYVASLADVVFRACEAGDPEAVSVIDRNAARLASLLNAGIEKYGAEPRAVTGGGIFEHNREIMQARMAAHTKAELIFTGLPPVYGACRKAYKCLVGTVPAEFCENFRTSYRKLREDNR